MKRLRTGISSYTLHPLRMMPAEMIRWAHEHGAEGVSFAGFEDDIRERFTSSCLRDTKKLADDLGMYLEWCNGHHLPFDPFTYQAKDIYLANRRAIGEAYGLRVGIIRSRSAGMIRWKKESPSVEHLLWETARELKREASLFRDNGMILAIESRFEFTTTELLALFDMCEVMPGDYLGICLDTLNCLAMLEDPLSATERILPWVVSTAIKDGCIIRNKDAFTVYPAPAGSGSIDLPGIIEMLNSEGRQININIEDHEGIFQVPANRKWFMENLPDLSGAELGRIYDICDISSLRMNETGLKVTSKEEWPSICGQRAESGIKALRSVQGGS